MAKGINCLINTSSKCWLCSRCLTALMHIHVLFSKSDLNCSWGSWRQAHTEITHVFIAFPYTQAHTHLIFRQTPVECRTCSNIYGRFRILPFLWLLWILFMFKLNTLAFHLSLEIVIFAKLICASRGWRTLWLWPNSHLRTGGEKNLSLLIPWMATHRNRGA